MLLYSISEKFEYCFGEICFIFLSFHCECIKFGNKNNCKLFAVESWEFNCLIKIYIFNLLHKENSRLAVSSTQKLNRTFLRKNTLLHTKGISKQKQKATT